MSFGCVWKYFEILLAKICLHEDVEFGRKKNYWTYLFHLGGNVMKTVRWFSSQGGGHPMGTTQKIAQDAFTKIGEKVYIQTQKHVEDSFYLNSHKPSCLNKKISGWIWSISTRTQGVMCSRSWTTCFTLFPRKSKEDHRNSWFKIKFEKFLSKEDCEFCIWKKDSKLT